MLRAMAMTALCLVGTAAQGQDMRRLSGELIYLPRIALPETADSVIEIRDAMDVIVAEARVPTAGRQVPVPFEIEAPAGTVLRLRAGFAEGGQIRWISEGVRIAPDDPDALGALRLSPFQPMGFASGYRCGARLVRVGFAGDKAVLDAGAGRILLDPVPAASGAKYDAPGQDTYFWERGGAATVRLDGVDLSECRLSFPIDADSFVARGTEPFWSVTVRAGDVVLGRMGSDSLTLPVTDSRMSDEGDIVIIAGSDAQPPRAVLTRRARICRDAMTGMPYPESVDLALEGAVLSGCGGDPADLLTGQTWVVEDVQGTRIIDSSRIEIAFDRDGRVSGTGGCNRFFGQYELGGEGLSLGALGATMMACPGALMRQEQRVFAALSGVDRFDRDDTGALLLIGGDTVLLRARAD